MQQAATSAVTSAANEINTRRSRAGRGALFIYMLLLMFVSLNPFSGWQLPQTLTLFDWPKYVTNFDVAINIVAYLPLGGMLLLVCQRRMSPTDTSRARFIAWCVAVIGGFCLSVAMELLQSMLPWRVSSPLDVVANTLGAAIGATILLMPLGSRTFSVFVSWRQRHFNRDSFVDWGLILLGIWFVAQLNPAIPFFEAGLIGHSGNDGKFGNSDLYPLVGNTAYDPLILLPQSVGKALNVTAFSLYVSLLLHPSKRVLPYVGLILIVGLLAKFAMAALLLKAPLVASSLSPATVFGVGVGLVLFVFFSGVRYRWRAFWATLLVFTGGVLAKLSSVYGALNETLTLFSWPHGQMANFTNMTRWLNEIWPVAVLLFLATIFIRSGYDSSDRSPDTTKIV